MKRPAVFIDRDGTINEQMGYINHVSRFVLLPGAAEAIRLLNENDVLAVVVSNQSGVARGYHPLDLVHEVHARMEALLREAGAVLDAVFFCPHHPRGPVPEFTQNCNCRKPRTGLVDRACEDFDIDMSRSWVVGDRYSDIELAHRCDIGGVLVKTGYGLGEALYILPRKRRQPDHVAEDLRDAVRWILRDGA
jgi:D-glycero-D-manno-heptose 1,7-bisphosphate phosphatase